MQDPRAVLRQTALAASVGPPKGETVGKDSGTKQEDLELTPEKAGDVKGGVLPPEPGGGTPRHVAVKHKTHKKHSATGPLQKMPHE
jgi:hypothetical protein